MKLTVFSSDATKSHEADFNVPTFEGNRGLQAVKEVVVAHNANARLGTHSTKTRGEVRGGGKKPWNQKGTGRARAGSIRSPIWVGGGVVFGPHPRDYSKKVSKKTKRVALRKALSAKIIAGDVFIVPSFSTPSPRTKDFIAMIGAISTEPKTLVISTGFDDNTKLAARNIQKTQLITSADVNTEHLLLYKKIILTNDALTQLAERINK